MLFKFNHMIEQDLYIYSVHLCVQCTVVHQIQASRNFIQKTSSCYPNQMKTHREVATSSMENSSGSKQDMPPLTHF